jgi:hypothetical protein
MKIERSRKLLAVQLAPDMHRRFRVHAATRALPMSHVLLELIERELEQAGQHATPAGTEGR